MAFDQKTRNLLQRTVTACRRALDREFTTQLQELYGIQPDGSLTPIAALNHLGDEELDVARLLRERINHLEGGSDAEALTRTAAKPEHIARVIREQAFTVLNRLAALRLCEERGLVLECVRQGVNSEGFQLFQSSAGNALGETHEAYRTYLHCLFDELALDLGVLFDRFSPLALLFPRPAALTEVLAELNGTGKAAEREELPPEQFAQIWQADETIGWIYQYYNDESERKKMREESAAPRNSRELAVRNQFFTPRYVVEFLTDNTLSRIWYEMTGGVTSLKEKCRYLVRRPNEIFLKPGETIPVLPRQDNLSQDELLRQTVFVPHRPLKDPRTILMLDPACGSMHFGLYAFDLFAVIYLEAWELEEKLGADTLIRPPGMKSLRETFATKEEFLRQVPRLIIEHNIHGIDIDPRAAQIAGLALWLRAQRGWKDMGLTPAQRPRITRSNIVCAEPMPGERELLREFVTKEFPAAEQGVFLQLLETIFDKMQLAGEAGSLLKIEEEIRTAIEDARIAWQKLQTKPKELFSTAELNAVSKQAELTALEPSIQSSILNPPSSIAVDFWDTVESRIYAALRDYAEQAENGGGFQRRLFAEDAARGFAFIDVCRKRYDVVVMNPPFGAETLLGVPIIQKFWKVGEHDLATAFVVQSFSRLETNGSVGVIMTRTPFFLSRFSDWRNEYLLHKQRPLALFADLGQGVLDSAMVEAVSAVFATGGGHLGAFDCRALGGKEAAPSEFANERAFRFDLSLLRNVPNQPLAYYAPQTTLAKFSELGLYGQNGEVKQGLATKDNDRFVRLWWEVSAEEMRLNARWRPYAKGGEYARFFLPLALVVDWSDAAQAVYKMRDGQMVVLLTAKRDRYLHRPGITYSKRSQLGFSARVMPSETIFSPNGPGVFPKSDSMLYFDLAFLNSSFSRACLEFLTSFGSYSEGYVESLAYTEPDPQTLLKVQTTSRECVEKSRALLQADEANKDFSGLSFVETPTLKGMEQHLQTIRSASIENLNRLFHEIDERIASALKLNEQDVAFAKRTAFSTALFADEDQTSDEPRGSVSFDCLSFVFGVAFGRWDIRYATGEQAAPELPDPFAPLPVCPPGQLQNAQGLPARPEDVPATYPITIQWDGIIVDDPTHPVDIERCVREVIETIWKPSTLNSQPSTPSPAAIEQEACEILGVNSLRDYFRRPAGFFADHLKRYSKSRRQAPIYWPLSTASGSYTLWIYYHRLDDQTLYRCLQQFVVPKLEDVEKELGKLRTVIAANEGSDKDRKRLEVLEDLRRDLIELRAELELWAPKWKPNLNDGVLITAAPLWKLFRLPKWQKDLKACWLELEKGDYDWAHLAYTLWPDRVREKCKTDRSLAIAHGLEDLCELKAPVKKAKKGRKVKDDETMI